MKDEPVNIIFINKGKTGYLPAVMKCARQSNPKAKIFLIDDGTNSEIDLIEHKNIYDYFNGAERFSKVYKHLSTNSHEFELFCIERWFVLRDFMKANQMDHCFYADSDVLIYADLFTERSKFSKHPFTLSEQTCGHNSFWNSYKAVEDFCDFVENVYNQTDSGTYKELTDFWQQYKLSGKSGGVCDMTLFDLYKKRHPEIGETAGVIDGSTHDHNILCSEQGGVKFRSILGMKRLFWRKNMPYSKSDKGEIIKFNTLHFCGWSKKLIDTVFLNKKFFLWIFLWGKCLILLKRFKKLLK